LTTDIKQTTIIKEQVHIIGVQEYSMEIIPTITETRPKAINHLRPTKSSSLAKYAINNPAGILSKNIKNEIIIILNNLDLN